MTEWVPRLDPGETTLKARSLISGSKNPSSFTKEGAEERAHKTGAETIRKILTGPVRGSNASGKVSKKKAEP